jgi:hypothetical protein
MSIDLNYYRDQYTLARKKTLQIADDCLALLDTHNPVQIAIAQSKEPELRTAVREERQAWDTYFEMLRVDFEGLQVKSQPENAMRRLAFEALSPIDRMAFIKQGGKLIE